MLGQKKIVVGGRAYADIDVLACVHAYTQLLTLKNEEAVGIITGPWNQTIPSSIRTWPIDIKKEFKIEPCSFILVDISDPRFMETFVSVDHVVEVFDHHYGFEAFWKERLPNTAYIESVGACATLIWEQFKESGLDPSISTVNANLLYTAIFANTLDFRAHVTTKRDRIAFEELFSYTELPENWKSHYYQEIEEGFKDALVTHIKKDAKTIHYGETPFNFGQIEVWNAGFALERMKEEFKPSDEWFINIASIEEGRSYFYTNSDRLKRSLKAIEAKPYAADLQVANRLWLRKELLRALFL